MILKTREHPFIGAKVAIDEAQALTRALKIDFALERITVKSADALAAAVIQAREKQGIHFFVVDAPADAFKPLAEAVGDATCCCSTPPLPRTGCAASSARAKSCIRCRASR